MQFVCAGLRRLCGKACSGVTLARCLAQPVCIQNRIGSFSARSWALLRFRYFGLSHGWICACVRINGVALWQEVRVRSALTVFVFGMYWVRASRRSDVVCETACGITRDLVGSAARSLCITICIRRQKGQRTVSNA